MIMTRSAISKGLIASLAVFCAAPAMAGWEKILNCVSDIHIVAIGNLTLDHEHSFTLVPAASVVGCVSMSDGSLVDKVTFSCAEETNESMTIAWHKTQVIGRCNPKLVPEVDVENEEESG